MPWFPYLIYYSLLAYSLSDYLTVIPIRKEIFVSNKGKCIGVRSDLGCFGTVFSRVVELTALSI